MKIVEIGLIYDPSGWALFCRKPGRENKGVIGVSEEFYKIYCVPASQEAAFKETLRTRIIHLEEQQVVPSAQNRSYVFPDIKTFSFL